LGAVCAWRARRPVLPVLCVDTKPGPSTWGAMTPARSRICLAAAIAVLLVIGPAAAKPPPGAKCLSAKLKATAKKGVAKVGCYAKAAKKQKPLDPACLG